MERRKTTRRHDERALTEEEIVDAIHALSGELQARTQARQQVAQVKRPHGRHTGLNDAILAILLRHPEGVGVQQLREEIGGMGLAPNHVDVQLSRFIRQGMVERNGIPRKSVYRLRSL